MPNKLALLAQLRLEYGTRPDGECESGVTKALTLPGPFAMKLRAPSVGRDEQNKSSDTFIAPALCVLQKLRTGGPDQRFVASLVALALTGALGLVAVINENVYAFLSLTTSSVTFGALHAVVLLNQLSAQVFEYVIAEGMKRRDFPRR